MHPHWQSTEDEQEVPVRMKTADTVKPSSPRGTRATAAAVGILLIIGLGAYSFGGLDGLIGQLTNPTPDQTVRLTQDGPMPPSVTLRPGQVVRWVNESQIPHVLSSETLPTDDGQPFVSTAIFPNVDYYYTVPPDATDATHAYISETSDLEGELVVQTGSAPAASSAASVPAVVSSVTTAPQPASSALPLPLPTQSSSSSVAATPLPANVIAVNPYTVGKRPGSTAKPVTQHKPTKNAESGPAAWIAFAVSAAAIVIVTRRAFRRV